MQIKTVLIFIFLFSITEVNAQVRSLIVQDIQSGTPITNANISNLRTKKTYTTNEYGNCLIEGLSEDSISISHVAYHDTTFVIKENTSEYILELRSMAIEGVNVFVGSSFKRPSNKGAYPVPLPFLTAIPSFLGEPDIIKSLTFLPGVSSGNEGYSHLFVRGGDQDQNLILFDGATMFNVNHMGGLISMFHPEMINNVNFYKSYWPSQYGGKLSSIVDVYTAEGDYKEHKQALQFSIISPKVKFEGPIWKDKISYNLGVRRTLFDLYTGPISRQLKRGERNGDIGNLASQDITLRLDGRISQNQHVSLSALLGKDKYAFIENYPNYNSSGEESYGINNKVLAFNYRIYNKKSSFFNAHLSYSGYNLSYSDEHNSQQNSGPTNIQKSALQKVSTTGNTLNSIKANVFGDTHINDAFGIRYGIEHEGLTYKIYLDRHEAIDKNIVSQLSSTNKNNNVSTTSVFSDVEHQINTKLISHFGVRFTRYNNASYNKWFIDPKAQLSFSIDESSTLKASFNMQRQHTILLGFTDDMGRFREYYVTSDKNIPPSVSNQWSVGYFKESNWIINKFALEMYYKNQSKTTKFIPSADFDKDILEYNNFLHNNGRNRIYGIEALLQKTAGNLQGSLAYTYAHSKSKFSTINQGNPFDADFDYRHSINALLFYNFGRGYQLSGSWSYKTGRPFSMPTSYSDTGDQFGGFYIVSDINNLRMPAFHRLDINIERKWQTKRGNKRWFGFGIYNVYNRVNPFFVQPSETPNKMEVIGMFPIIPFFNIGFEL